MVMNSKRLKEKFDEIVNDYQPSAEMDRLFNKALESEILDLDEKTIEDYRLAKIIWYAILLKMAADCRPLDPQNRKEAENLLLFL